LQNVTIVVLFFSSVLVLLGSLNSIQYTEGAVTPTNISACQTLNIIGETYVLTSDIITTDNCLVITADGITLDGNGHKIVGDGSGILGDQVGDIGVDIISATGVTVQNLDISFFRSGVFLDSSNVNTVTNNVIHQISKYGVGLDGSSNNLISNNFFDTSQNGVHAAASESNGNTITLNTFFQSNHEQVHLHATNDNNLVYHNNFLELTGLNIHDQCNGCNNQYSVASGGNYYDDYDEPNEGCNDTNSDGFCDDPFIIDPNNQDDLPFTVQNGWDLAPDLDLDGDGVADQDDNCPNTPNPSQEDFDKPFSFYDTIIYGTNGNDNLPGTDGRDIILALGGDDTVNGGKKRDCIIGGKGKDTLNGNGGNDRIFGKGQSDTINGGVGKDVIKSGTQNDVVNGNKGDDRINCGRGNSDSADGGAGTDTAVNCENTSNIP